MIEVFKYVWSENRGLGKFIYLFKGVCFQLFKRITARTISQKIFNGQQIFLFPKCNVSSSFAYTKIPDRSEILLLRSLVNENTVFLDIGANVGSYSVCLSDICSEIYAFEPHPFTSKRCKMNFLLNNIDESRVILLALSDINGNVYFSDNGSSSTVNCIVPVNSGLEVNSMRLDDFVESKSFPDGSEFLLKVDVEGFEKKLFRGAERFLKTAKIQGIIFESFQSEEVISMLKDIGFNSFKQISRNNFFATRS